MSQQNDAAESDRLKSHGYRRIASAAHAEQLMRRELKQHRRRQQMDISAGVRHHPQYDKMLNIRHGSWYKFMKLRVTTFRASRRLVVHEAMARVELVVIPDTSR